MLFFGIDASDEDLDEENDDSDDDALKPYECGLCPGVKFSTVEGLEKHVETCLNTPKNESSPPKKVRKSPKTSKDKAKEEAEEVIKALLISFCFSLKVKRTRRVLWRSTRGRCVARSTPRT